jgi:vitamin B12 transporter
MVPGRFIFLSVHISEAVTQKPFHIMKKGIFVVAAAVCSHVVPAQDTTGTRQMDEVIITATRSELKQSQTGKVVTVIDRAALDRSQGKGLADVLNEQAGIFINGAGNTLGTNQDLYFRGASTGNVLVLMDGVPVNDPSQINTYFDLNHVQLEQVERIEVLRGAQSTLWGSNAMAGVINIITRKSGTRLFSPTLALSYGSYNTLHMNAGINGRYGKLDYQASYGHIASKGFSSAHDSIGNQGFERDAYRQDNAMASLGYAITGRLSARYTGQFSRYDADIDAGAFADDKDYVSKSKNLVNSLVLKYRTGKAKLSLSQTLLHAAREVNDDSASIGGFNIWSESSYIGNSSITDLTGEFELGRHLTLVAGSQFLAQNTSQYYRSISAYGPFNSLPLNQDTAANRNLSLFSSLLLLDLSGFNAEAGLRYNHHNIYGSNSTWTFNTSWSVNAHARIFLNISSAYRTPSLYQLYSEYGNKGLKPEEAVNYELGFQAHLGDKRSSLRVVGFRRDTRNLIIFYSDPSTYESRYINRDEQHDLGLELESDIYLGKMGNWRTNMTYVDGEGLSEGVKTKNLYRRPHIMANTSITLTLAKKWTVTPSFRFVGNRPSGPYDPAPAVMPAYYTVDLYAGYALSLAATAFIDLRNLTDQRYFEITGYNTRQRNIMAGIRLTL